MYDGDAKRVFVREEQVAIVESNGDRKKIVDNNGEGRLGEMTKLTAFVQAIDGATQTIL